MVFTVPCSHLRWGWLLASHAIHERVPWLTRAYFVAYTAGQVLPTSLGGDAVRVGRDHEAASRAREPS
jgi:uncharacterized membrane protein YbhN (UPF0104 family)